MNVRRVRSVVVVVRSVAIVDHAAHVVRMTDCFTVSTIHFHLVLASIHNLILVVVVVVNIMDRTCGSWRVSR